MKEVVVKAGFLRWPWIQGAGLEFKASFEKSLNFIKLKMSLNCFGKQVEGLWKVWNLPMWNFQQDLVTVRTSCHSCY